MAKALRGVAILAGAVALTATGLGAFLGPTALAALGTSTAGLASIAAIASTVSVAPSAPHQILSKGAGP